jgi:hypothetical protein
MVMIRRNREFVLKKVFGAESYQIFVQLFVENLLPTLVSLGIAFWLAAALGTFVENAFDIRQYSSLRFDICLALVLTVTLPAAISVAPYLRYRYFSPLRSLRQVNAGSKSLFSRKFFLCFQYFITMGLIVVSLFFIKQLNFMLDKDLGFRAQNIIRVPFLKSYFGNLNISNEEYDAKKQKEKEIMTVLAQKMNASPLFERWSFADFCIGGKTLLEYRFTVAGKEARCQMMGADETWFKLFDVQLLEGNLFDDETVGHNMIVNESFIKQFGVIDYRDALIQLPNQRTGGNGEKTGPSYRITGVVKDFHLEHLSRPIKPAVFYFHTVSSYSYDPVMAAFAPERRREVIEFMKNLHDELVGGEFTYSFIEDEIGAMYKDDKKAAMICTVFTGVAILISMLGLFGVSLFDVRQRRKEIAIRKIHGARIIDIMRLLLKKYFVVLSGAFAISIPATLFVIIKYLENFAVKAPISWWLYAVALLVTVAVSLLTLLYQTYTASNENPAVVIKSET